MIEDDQTVIEMRSKRAEPQTPRAFMTAAELRLLRTTVIRVSQPRLAAQLIKPSTGTSITAKSISFYEIGARPVPLWVARRVRELAELAKRYDAKGGA